MYDDIEFIIAAGGKSTRNYPHSKGLPHKCLMPFGDVRLIDFVLREIIDMGGRHITMVCSTQEVIDGFKEALKTDKAIVEKMRSKNRHKIADAIEETFLPEDIDLKFIIQKVPIGTCQVMALGHKLSPNRHGVLIFPDDIIVSKDRKNSNLKKMVDLFLKNPKQIVVLGVEKEDVSNNAILTNKRLIEKPKVPANHVGIFSPCVFPKELLDFITKENDEIERTGQMPRQLSVGEWVYVDGINSFLDSLEDDSLYPITVYKKDEDDLLLDTGILHLYQQAQLLALLKLSRFKEDNIAYVKKLLDIK